MTAEVTSAKKAAAQLIAAVNNALLDGILHFRESDGKLLTTTLEILETILAEGKVVFRPTKNQLNR